MKRAHARVLALLVAGGPCAGLAQEAGSEPPLPRVDAVLRGLALNTPRAWNRPEVWGEGVVQAQATLDATPDTRLRVDGRVATLSQENRLIEAWVSHRFGESELRVGRQVMAWGRADGLNPTDNLSPRDYRTWLPYDEDQRFGTWALRLDTRPAPSLDLTLVASPYFQGSAIALSPGGPAVAEAPDTHRAGNGLFAAKLTRTGEALDWSLSWMRGLALLPGIRADAAGSGALAFHHDRVEVLGADVAANAGRFGLRAEVAWTRPRAGDDGRPAQRRPDVHAVVGADRTVFDNLNLNVQLFGRHVSDFSDPYAGAPGAQRALDIQNAITFGQQDRDSLGWTLRVSDKWLQETLKADVLLVRNMTRSNHFVRSVLSYAVSDRWTVAAGAVHHWGAADTNFGRKRPGNRVFLELRYGL